MSRKWPVQDAQRVSELRRFRPHERAGDSIATEYPLGREVGLCTSVQHGAVLDWIADVSAEQIFVSAVTVGEIQAGIEITR